MEILENIVQTSGILLIIGLLVPQLAEDPLYWVKALVLIPALVSIPVLAIGSTVLVWLN